MLGLTVWAVRRVLRTDDPGLRPGDQAVLALICVAMFGLVVSPVSWSHHWVWALPAVLATARARGTATATSRWASISAAGVLLMYFAPIHLMTEHKETSAALWRQLLGGSYVWWAIALIVVAGAVTLRERDGTRCGTSTPRPRTRRPSPRRRWESGRAACRRTRLRPS